MRNGKGNGGKRVKRPTINQCRATRQAAAKVYYDTLAQWQSDQDNTRVADKHLQAWRNWRDAQEQFERARRRANWKRAERIVLLAANGRGERWAARFVAAGYEVVR